LFSFGIWVLQEWDLHIYFSQHKITIRC